MTGCWSRRYSADECRLSAPPSASAVSACTSGRRQSSPALLPPATDPAGRAHVRLWVAHVAEKVIPFYYRLLMAQGEEARDSARAVRARQAELRSEIWARASELREVFESTLDETPRSLHATG